MFKILKKIIFNQFLGKINSIPKPETFITDNSPLNWSANLRIIIKPKLLQVKILTSSCKPTPSSQTRKT